MTRRQTGVRHRLLVVSATGLVVAACGTVKSPTEPGGGGPDIVFTFIQIQNEIFTPTCAKAGCHVRGVAAGNLVLEAGRSFDELVGVPAQGNPAFRRVEPGDPERSYLVKKLRGDPDIVGDRMPLDGPPFLTEEQIAGIAGWIRTGAPRN